MSELRKISKEELAEILRLHIKWINSEFDGIMADLSNADLSFAKLNCANLKGADLSGADLSGADLSFAKLNCANLKGADLSGADLSGADLSNANLRSANLSGADLSGADLSNAKLSGAEILTFQYNKHFSFCTFDGYITIGCHRLKIQEWIDQYLEVGNKNGYTEREITAYKEFILMCQRMQVEHDKQLKEIEE